MSKTAIITGITGQLGAVLAEKLLKDDYKIYGIRRRSSVFNTTRIEHILQDVHINDRLELVYGDLSDYASICNLLLDVKPDLFLNTAAQSHVRVSFEIPEYTMDITGTGVMRCLEAIKKHSINTRFLQCSSSELFGNQPAPQNENTPFNPRSPYAVAKAAGYYATVNYREAYGMFASNAIMFNYEGPTRGETFVTRKITRAATRIFMGLQDKLYLGNLSAKRDWSHVDDTANAVIKIINADNPNDYCVSTGEIHSVKEFCQKTFSLLGLDYKKYVMLDERYLRPAEVDELRGDSSKLRNELNWEPKYNFDMLVKEMVYSDLELAKIEVATKKIKGLK